MFGAGRLAGGWMCTPMPDVALAWAIDVDDRDEIAEAVNPGERRRFPHAALGAFAVAHQHVSAEVEIIQARAESHAHADAEPLSKRTGRDIHKRQARRRMAFEVTGEFAEAEQLMDGDQTIFGPGGVKHRRSVA